VLLGKSGFGRNAVLRQVADSFVLSSLN